MKHYSLSEFNGLVKQTLSGHLEASYWIIAEIGQINIQAKGHCYLELVEKENNYVKAKIRATIWANSFIKLHQWFISVTGSPLKQGMNIMLNGSLDFHEVFGLNLNIKDIDANFTLGERERKKRETINQLEEEGIMDMNQSLEVPNIIQRIAIISSETAAGYEDFRNQFENNKWGYQANFQLFHSVMQGDNASDSIIKSLHQIYEDIEDFDAIIIIRGGGSQLDLDCFDDYNLCAHIAQFPLPIITGIGHERDQSIADMVAHTNLKTPTSVAEFLLGGMFEFENTILNLSEGIKQGTKEVLSNHGEQLSSIKHQVELETRNLLQEASYKVGNLKYIVDQRPKAILSNHQVALQNMTKLIEAYNPKVLLKKGYSISKINGKPSLLTKAKKGDQIETITQHQVIISTVEEVK